MRGLCAGFRGEALDHFLVDRHFGFRTLNLLSGTRSELFEILGLEDGVFELDDVLSYMSDLWNVMDWICYTLYVQVERDVRTC